MVRAPQTWGRADDDTPEVLKLTRRMTMLFRDRLEERLRPVGVTAAQLQVLATLSKEPESSGAQISRYCQVTPQTTHALLAAAERRGWIRRAPHPENSHTLLATLTPDGRRVVARGRTIALRLQRQMLSPLSDWQIRALESTLALFVANLEAPSAGAAAPPRGDRRRGARHSKRLAD